MRGRQRLRASAENALRASVLGGLTTLNTGQRHAARFICELSWTMPVVSRSAVPRAMASAGPELMACQTTVVCQAGLALLFLNGKPEDFLPVLLIIEKASGEQERPGYSRVPEIQSAAMQPPISIQYQ